jgi:hypothetical protein
MEDFIGKYNGGQIESRLDKVKDMVGATASGAGAAGLVPAPAAEKRTAFLRGDGTWQDIDVHEPGFLGDNLDSEDDFRTILFNLGFDKEFTLTKAKYDIIASKCEVDIPIQYLLSGASSTYGVGDLILIKDSSGNIQAMLRSGCNTGAGVIVSYHVMINISSDLTHTSIVTSHTVQSVSNQTKDISLTIGGDPVGDNRGINFSTAGTGTKALMDNGKYKEVQARGDIENAFLDTVFHLASNQPSTLTQDQYNTIKSLFGSNPTSNIRMIKPSDSFVELLGEFLINDLMVFNDQRNDCITIYISGSNIILGMGLMDISISVYPNLSVGYINSNSNVAASDGSEIVLVNSLKNTEDDIDFDNQLHLKMKGKGDKALMDDGTYKEIGSSGVDISSYILEGIDFKKNTTKEGFDKIKSCVINKQHMYLYFYNAVGGDEASFYADVIAGVLYGNLNLCVYDFGSSKIVNIDINLQDYSITVNTQ